MITNKSKLFFQSNAIEWYMAELKKYKKLYFELQIELNKLDRLRKNRTYVLLKREELLELEKLDRLRKSYTHDLVKREELPEQDKLDRLRKSHMHILVKREEFQRDVTDDDITCDCDC